MPHRSAYFWFDFFRFAAAFVVVLEHARDLLWINAAEASAAGGGINPAYKAIYFLTGFGHEAVMVFFVLSGFWISSAIDRRKDAPAFWGNYLIDRLSRLMVVLLPALAIGGILDMLGIFAFAGPLYFGETGAATLQNNVAMHLTPLAFLGNVLFLQTLAVPAFGSNGPLWSLAHEFWYYLWYPALLLAFTRRRWSLFIASLAIGLIWPKLLPGFAVWLLGSGIYHADKAGWGRSFFDPKRALVLTLFALALCAISLPASRMGMLPYSLADIAVGGSFALLVWSVLLLEPAFPRFAQPLARYGAGASFSLYVTHFPALALFSTFALGGNRLAPGAGSIGVIGGAIGLVMLYGWLFARVTEGHTSQVRQWLRGRLTVPEPA